MIERGNTGRGSREVLSLASYSLNAQSTATADLFGRPQRPFRPDYLIVTAHKEGGNGLTSIVVVDIKIGVQSQLCGSGKELPQEMFAPGAFDGRPDDFEIIDAGLHAIVTVRNDDVAAAQPQTGGYACFKGSTIG